MLPTSFFQPADGRYVAWFMTLLLFVISAQPLKKLVAALIMKLYEIFIQKGQIS